MWWLLATGLLLGCCSALYRYAALPLAHLIESRRFGKAREQFRREREWLEARFLSVLSVKEPVERIRWETADWEDDIVWARDVRGRRLMALIGIQFRPALLADLGSEPEHATAVFTYRKGRWLAEGERLDAVGPDEACARGKGYEAVARTRSRA